MRVGISLCDKCGNNPDGRLEAIRITFWNGERVIDKELFLCSYCAREFLTTVELFESAAEDLKKRSLKEQIAHVYSTVGQREDSNANESS